MPLSLVYAFAVSFAVALAVTPLVIALARSRGWVVAPREDRWHKKPTAVFGGVAIYLAFAAAFFAFWNHTFEYWMIMATGSGVFLLGLVDDILDLKPQVKFLGQVLAATCAVALGVRLAVIPWDWLSIPVSVLWLVGITNAVNILDNMDGLSSGVSLVAGLTLAASGVIFGSPESAILGVILAGAAAGFLVFNFNPAKIFMGDCGSLFLGFTLGAAALMTTGKEAGHLIFSLLIPLGMLIVPIFDTTLVTFQRTSHGLSIATGGRDHSSHRLVFLGLSERRAVLLLMAISAAGGLGSLLLAAYAPPLAAGVVAVLVVVFLTFLGIYLGGVKVYEGNRPKRAISDNPVLGGLIAYKKQLLQIAVDLLLVSAAYAGAYLLRFEGAPPASDMRLMTTSLPVVLAAKMACFWFFGLYKGDWRYVSVRDMIQIAKATACASVVMLIVFVSWFRFAGFSRAVMFIDLVLCFLFVAGCRSLIRIFRESIVGRGGVAVLVLGAGDAGELLMRELKNNPDLAYKPVGFLDDDPAKQGGMIHGVPILGGRNELARAIKEHQVEHVFIAIFKDQGQDFADVFKTCRELEVGCSRLQPMIKL